MVLVEVLHQKIVQYELDLDFTFYLSCVDLVLQVIYQSKCIPLKMVWDLEDKVGPSSKISMSIKVWARFLIALRFSIGYLSQQFPQHLPYPCQDQWVCVKNVLSNSITSYKLNFQC